MSGKRQGARKPGKSWLTWLIGQLHLWLGLASGIVVLIVSVTGCLFVFQKEISEKIYHSSMFVTPQQTPVLPLSQLQKQAQAALGSDRPVNFITTYRKPDRAWEFMAYKSNEKALTYFGAIEYYTSVFVNPYDGKVTGIRDYKYDFFSIMKYMHWSLLLSTRIGQPIVGWSTLVFVLLLITGLVLWWPKKWNKANRDKSFKIKWKAGFKRVNYDLHNVLGFYSLLLALVLALTGMVWAFSWFEKAVYVTAAGTTAAPERVAVKSVPIAVSPGVHPIDIAYANALTQLPDAYRIGVSPASGEGEAPIYINGYRGKEVYYDRDDLQYDQYSGQLLHRRNASEKNRGEKLIGMNYDIHVGAIGGLPGKIIAFIISAICASLPVTGFLVWWNKKKKSKKKSPVQRRKAVIVAQPLKAPVPEASAQ